MRGSCFRADYFLLHRSGCLCSLTGVLYYCLGISYAISLKWIALHAMTQKAVSISSR